MSFNITTRINNLTSTTEIIIRSLSDLQNLINSYLTVDDARGLYQLLTNIAQTYNNNPTDTIYYSAKYINSLISNYQNKLNVSMPLYLNNTTNILSIDLNDYYTKSESDSSYQEVLNVTFPIILNNISNNLSIDLTNYYNSTTSDNKYQGKINVNLPLILNSASNNLSIDLSTYATQVYVSNAISNLINSAPNSLDTLKELANAINNDSAFSTTINNLINTKQNIITATNPLSLTNNTLSITLLNYYTKSESDSNYQVKLTAVLPLSINTTTNMLSINLSAYATKTNLTDGINNIIDGAPANLNTLKELAAAINNDNNFHTTITNLINTKQKTLVVSSPLSLNDDVLTLNFDGSVYQPLITSTSVLGPDRVTCSSIMVNDITGGSMSFARFNNSISFTYDQGFISLYDNRQAGTDQIVSSLSITPSGSTITYISNGIINSLSVNSDGVNITGSYNYSGLLKTNGITVYNNSTLAAQISANGDISTTTTILSPTIKINNASSDFPLSISYLGTDICTVNNDGLINCNALRTNTTDGLEIYDGINKNLQITSNGNINTFGNLVFNLNNYSNVNAITCYDKVTNTILWNISQSGQPLFKNLHVYGKISVFPTSGGTSNIALFGSNGSISCSGLNLDNDASGQGLHVYGRDNSNNRIVTSSISQDGTFSCTSVTIKSLDTPNYQVAAFSQSGNVTCKNITCDTITIDNFIYKPPVERIIMLNLRPTSAITSSMIPGWNFTWQGNNRNLKVSIQITCYTSVANVTATWYMCKRRVGETGFEIVCSCLFYFNQALLHMTMPTLYAVDISRTSYNMEYFVATGPNCVVDSNDTCTIITTEYY